MYFLSLDPVKVSQKNSCHQKYRDNAKFCRSPHFQQFQASHQWIINSNQVSTSIIWFGSTYLITVINYHLNNSKKHNKTHHFWSFLIEKTIFITLDWDFLALSTHFGHHQDQSQTDISDEESWVTHAHVNDVDQSFTMMFIFSLDPPLKIL